MTLAIILTRSSLLLGTGYILPALASTKGSTNKLFRCNLAFPRRQLTHSICFAGSAVLRKDVNAYYKFLTFWLIMALYSSLEPLLVVMLHPMIVLVFSLLLTLPTYQGTKTIYDVTVRPMFQKHESYLEQKIDAVKSKVNLMFFYILSEMGCGIFHHILIIAQRIGKNTISDSNESGQTNS
jgi:hypothetical protein